MKSIKAKTKATAYPLTVGNPDVSYGLQAEGWCPVNLPTVSRNYNVTQDYLIYDQVCNIKDYGVTFDNDDLVKPDTDTRNDLSTIKSISDLPVVQDMRVPKSSVSIALDTEYYVDDDHQRHVLSWQFCFIKDQLIYKVLVFPKSEKLLEFDKVLSFLIDFYDLYTPFQEKNGYKYNDFKRWEVPVKQKNGKVKKVVCSSYDEAINICTDKKHKTKLSEIGPKTEAPFGVKTKYREGYFYDYKEVNKHSIPITLIMHFSPADLTTLGITDNHGIDVLNYCSSIQGGIVTLSPIKKNIKNHHGYGRFYPISLSIRDTICFAPDGKKSLDNLGETIGMNKVELPVGYSKDKMQDFLLGNPGLFAEYASRDAVITLLYASKLWGVNQQMPITLSSAACLAGVPRIKQYFGLNEDQIEEYNKVYRGLRKVEKGKIQTSNGLRQNTDWVPLNDDTEIVWRLSTNSYHGGFNGSSEIGYYFNQTYDFDLQGAYPTAMACVVDIDWDDPIEEEYKDIDVTIDMFDSPVDPILGYVKYEFPAGTRYPSVPINVDGCIIFPLSSSKDYVYATGPEIYLALKLGAKVKAHRFYKLRKLMTSNGEESHCLLEMVRSFIKNRATAKKIFGEKSLEQLLIKLATNSLYGKVAQNVIKKKSWSARDEQMVEIGPSQMTSPYHATMITAIVRCILIAAMNQVEMQGFHAYSVTTDGFISDAPLEVIQTLDLFGLKTIMESARADLTGNKDIWEVKHTQQELLNITTRGNVGFNWYQSSKSASFDDEVYVTDDEGVLAHNGYKSDKGLTPIQDRINFAKKVLGRTGKVECVVPVKTTFRKLSSKDAREDFIIKEEKKSLSMDFDMKRKPVKESLYTANPKIDGQTFEIACFTTVPFNDVEEYKLYKSKAKNSLVLRTVSNWNSFFERVSRTLNGEKRVAITDYNKRLLQSCVMAVTQGVEVKALGGKADIPMILDKNISISKKLNWINKFNQGETIFSNNDWRNCKRKDRLYQLLPEEEFLPLLMKMIHSSEG